jgi:hypothetical protein
VPLKRPVDHVVLIDNGFHCKRCGDRYVMNMPCSILVFAAAAKAYVREHRRCPAPVQRVRPKKA